MKKKTKLTSFIVNSQSEGDRLYLRMNADGDVVRHPILIETVWGEESSASANTLKVHIHNLREKLRDTTDNRGIIKTWPGLGYSLEIQTFSGVEY